MVKVKRSTFLTFTAANFTYKLSYWLWYVLFSATLIYILQLGVKCNFSCIKRKTLNFKMIIKIYAYWSSLVYVKDYLEVFLFHLRKLDYIQSHQEWFPKGI